ncbi:MAG TPA: tryptophan-rich sensory protein [Vitreimonas sp.]|uniref:tryptophan-rich sensory protein n=1 Tax=Vitreimonas sp. TaxID=3069702 RepID=UPI002D72037E|nr:tryptophan-rich sensory protein [Vitreimonas sp.]HYD86182.1 tryptophan-rich sensory protein [Vitreimonas sp.]
MTDVILGKPSRTPWNRNDKRGLAISAVAPFIAALVVNGVIYAARWNAYPAFDAIRLDPPGWLMSAAWLVIFPLWGAARWYAYQTGLSGRRASYWIVALMVWSLLYPFLVAGANPGVSAGATLIAFGLALAAAAQARRVSKRAAWLIAPSLLWIGFAAILSFAALDTA